MTCNEVIEKIHSRRVFSAGGPTLDRIRRLMDRLGNPQEDYKVIHVAGTNGKGSCSAMLDAALRENGCSTGLFTSPYLKDFRERICLNGEMISPELLIECYEAVMVHQKAIEDEGFEPINEFELVTAIAFLAYSRAKMDYVVLEVGLGGRSDPTNLIKCPAAAVIMPVSLDHTAILGTTIEQIADEKAGIIKEGCPVVAARQAPEAMEVISKTAEHFHAPLLSAASVQPISQGKHGSVFLAGKQELRIPLLGSHQMENASAAWTVCSLLKLDKENTLKAFSKVSWPGRLQYLEGNPATLIDAAHNEAGVAALCQTLSQLFSEKRIITVMAMMKDKDYKSCISSVARISSVLIGTTLGLPRSLEKEAIASEAMSFCTAYTADSLSQALTLARAEAAGEDLILICGSVYAAGEALTILEN